MRFSILDIRKKIAYSKDTKINNIPSGKVMVCLDKLVADGFAEIQEKEPDKGEFARAANGVRRYRKISAGLYKSYKDRGLGLVIV